MDGTIDFIILEHDDVAECALIAGAVDGVVPAIDGYNTPYVVAKGYDHATRNWEAVSYTHLTLPTNSLV